MKQFFLFLSTAALLVANRAQAQLPFSTKDSVNINNINAQVLVHGDMWWDPALGVAKCEFPKGSGKHIGFMSALWMSGYDAGGQLHVAAQTYRQDGNDYWPGPLDASDTLTYANSQKWAKIWKVNRTDIQSFLAITSHTTTNTPAAILTWPASGNANAAGNGGAALTIAAGTNMAPFVDLNGNGVYEPLAGEYPDVKGDQALWYVFSDNGPSHQVSMAAPLGVEIHAQAYAYNRTGLINNIIYYEYLITNHSANTYHNFRMSQFSDVDLGYYNDDFIGYDSAHRMAITYNGAALDGSAGGFPANSYGAGAPVVGVTMVVLPGDTGTSYVPAGNFDYYRNDASVIGNPTNGVQYDGYMRGAIRNGDPFTNDFTGAGHVTQAYGSGPTVRYVFPGDPSDTSQWSECASGNSPGDRRFIISSNDFNLAPGQTKKIVMALVTTDTGQGGCPNVNFNDVKTVADTAWHYYYHPFPLAVDGGIMKNEDGLIVYPNPANDKLYITTTTNADAQIAIYNTVGQLINVPITGGRIKEANISNFPAGIYYLLYRSGTTQQAIRFEKL